MRTNNRATLLVHWHSLLADYSLIYGLFATRGRDEPAFPYGLRRNRLRMRNRQTVQPPTAASSRSSRDRLRDTELP